MMNKAYKVKFALLRTTIIVILPATDKFVQALASSWFNSIVLFVITPPVEVKS